MPDLTPKEDFHHASDLIAFIRAHAKDRFQIFAACYPEGHIEAPDLDTDIGNLRRKVDAGVDRLISQLFFDNAFSEQSAKSRNQRSRRSRHHARHEQKAD